MKLPVFVLGFVLALGSLSTAGAQTQNVSYAYDQTGRLISVTYPNGNIMTYTYDANGSLLRRLVVKPGSNPAPTDLT